VEHDGLERGHMLEGVEELVGRREDELGALRGLAQVGPKDVQARERCERRASADRPAGEERAIDGEAAEGRVRREEVALEGHGDVVARARTMRVDAEAEDLDERRGPLEGADPRRMLHAPAASSSSCTWKRCCASTSTVAVALRSRLLRGRGGYCRAVLCRGRGCCVVAVGDVAPCVVALRGAAFAVGDWTRVGPAGRGRLRIRRQ